MTEARSKKRQSVLPAGFAGAGPNGSFFEAPEWVDQSKVRPSKNSIFQREITPRFRVKRFGDRASTMALLARFSSDFSLQIKATR